ncbi:MAG TPA: hypothetical protein VGN33_01200 [Leifsonia sp.]|jgi:uncharacterized integral membrane protein|nr:hypothetical protein [Leifsonia sp.]
MTSATDTRTAAPLYAKVGFWIGIAVAVVSAALLVWINAPSTDAAWSLSWSAAVPLSVAVLVLAAAGAAITARASAFPARHARLAIAGTTLNAASFGCVLAVLPGLLRM